MTEYTPSQSYELDKEIFGKLTKQEATILDFMLARGADRASQIMNDGRFVWDLAGMTELARISGSLAAWLGFIGPFE